MTSSHLCIHGHFYQPPRENPFTERIPREPEAAPYANWNERITAECYAPNAQVGNLRRISFNLGDTLARWLKENVPTTFQQIAAQERGHQALAQSMHHTILPLARRRDKICQVRWGIASFQSCFGHRPEGMWLPEMAVDYETLEVMADEGLRFTILSDDQVRGELEDGAGPYRVRLPNGKDFAIFVRDRDLSNALSFHMPEPDRVEEWLRRQMEWRRRRGGLSLVATDGETFGHHHRRGVEVLKRLLDAADAHGYGLTTLGDYLHRHPARAELEVIEYTAWSCTHGVDRWVVGCGCTPGDSRWKGTLRRALDSLASELDIAYAFEAGRLGIEPWPLRDNYIVVVLGEMDESTFLFNHDLGHLSSWEAQRLLKLLEAQFYRQRMYASCAFFFEDLERLEPRYAIASGVRALALTHYATREDLTPGFRRDLGVVVSGRTDRTGAEILDEMLKRAEV